MLAAGCAGGPHDLGTRGTFGDLGATVATLLGADAHDLVGESFAAAIGFDGVTLGSARRDRTRSEPAARSPRPTCIA